MIGALGALARPLLFALEPEQAHRLAIVALSLTPTASPARDARLATAAFGIDFPNPLGMAAGFDKNAEVPNGLLSLGFGFVEVGTLTPLPQPGNPRPRLFRLPREQALINRLGFNNQGYDSAHSRLTARRRIGIVGVNIGPNKDSSDRIADYLLGIRAFADVASYFTINISSPNTPGLRDLQQKDALDVLVARVIETRDAQTRRRPVLIKIAPDVDLATLDDIVAVARSRGADGMIISNTTISRPAGFSDSKAQETGGLSGAPLFSLSTRILAETYLRAEGAFPLIGCGGIDSAAAAYAKVRAGASLLQLYSALIFHGPLLVPQILAGLRARLDTDGHRTIAQAVGADARTLTQTNASG
jgi:dihydroorotate dehydrogenase